MKSLSIIFPRDVLNNEQFTYILLIKSQNKDGNVKIKLKKGMFDSQGSRLQTIVARNNDNEIKLGFDFTKPPPHPYTSY